MLQPNQNLCAVGSGEIRLDQLVSGISRQAPAYSQTPMMLAPSRRSLPSWALGALLGMGSLLLVVLATTIALVVTSPEQPPPPAAVASALANPGSDGEQAEPALPAAAEHAVDVEHERVAKKSPASPRHDRGVQKVDEPPKKVAKARKVKRSKRKMSRARRRWLAKRHRLRRLRARRKARRRRALARRRRARRKARAHTPRRKTRAEDDIDRILDTAIN